ncbi:MAG: hypothetical protein K1X64_00540 [Myxococcaceae bacterium]|nr:hypothetical protein [Myxococcaceae bacterium]
MDPIERICRYVYGELPVEALHGALVEMPALEEVLGKTEYHDLVTFDPVTGREHGFRRSTFELFEARLPGVLLKARARRVCQQMLGGEKDVVQGVQEMSLLREERCGEQFVPRIFADLEHKALVLLTINQDEGCKKDIAVEHCGPAILNAAREFLAK